MPSSRIRTTKYEQRKFFHTIKTVSGWPWPRLAKLCHVAPRTLRTWAKASFTVPETAYLLLSRQFRVTLPKRRITLAPYWFLKKYASRGGIARQAKYGLLGNRETRRHGGLISQLRRRQAPEKYRRLGCNVRKRIHSLHPSAALAELFGILLGDGAITDYQIRVTLNRETDQAYAEAVSLLIKKIFHEEPSRIERENVVNLTISGVGWVEALEQFGLRRGNKVANQVSIPEWISSQALYARACLRGLIDTDGSVYFHHHVTHNIRYVHCGLTFTNHSWPLVEGVYRILCRQDFRASIAKKRRVYIYNLGDVQRYFKVIGSHNPKHCQRLQAYLNAHQQHQHRLIGNQRFIWKGAGVA